MLINKVEQFKIASGNAEYVRALLSITESVRIDADLKTFVRAVDVNLGDGFAGHQVGRNELLFG